MNWVPRATQILLLWKVSSTMMKFDENHWMVWELKYRNIGDWKNRTLFSREGWSSLHQKARMASTRSDSPRAVLAYVVLVSEKAEVPEDTENLMSTVCQQQQTTWAQEFHSKQTNEWNNFHIVDSPRDPRLELQPSLCIWCTENIPVYYSALCRNPSFYDHLSSSRFHMASNSLYSKSLSTKDWCHSTHIS